jgi:hypothetical protein
MTNPAVTWAELSRRARTSLGRVRTADATFRVVEPGRDVTGEPREATLRVRYAAPDSCRVDRDGEPELIRVGDQRPSPAPGGAPEQPLAGLAAEGIPEVGWGPTGLFREPSAPDALEAPVPVTLAGRAAWEVTVAAPGRRPRLMRVVVDDATGLLLGQAAEGMPYLTEARSLVVDDPLPEDTFAWGGGAGRPTGDRERRFGHDLPVPGYWPARPVWHVERVDPGSGSYVARLDPGVGNALLVRRPAEAAATAEAAVDGAGPLRPATTVDGWRVDGPKLQYAWSDGSWHWTLLVASPLGEEDLARVRGSIG